MSSDREISHSPYLEDWHYAILPANATIQDAILNLDNVALQIVLVLAEDRTLIGTLSDGDIRRGLLKGLGLGSPIEPIIRRQPLVVPNTLTRELVMQLMMVNKVRQIPIVDEENRVVGLHLWDQVALPTAHPNKLVIMAGGKGTRLLPHTENCPKPMLKIGDRPMLEHIIERAKAEGFNKFILATHYMAHVIEEYFGNGHRHGVQISYIHEHSPLGTAGALALLNFVPEQTLLVTNGDILTDIRYGELLAFHERQGADATMAVRLHEWQHPFGVVQLRGVEINGFEEKPVNRSYINAGVYAISPKALESLTANQPCDMPTLFERLKLRGMRTVAYPMHEPWLDVGRVDDLTRANTVFTERAKTDYESN